MSYKTILVHITSDSRCLERFDVAVNLAQDLDASLLAVHAVFPYIPPGYILAQMGQDVVASQKKASLERMAKTEASMREHLADRDFSNSVEWHQEISDPCAALC